jgi:hypothetical protein
MIAVFAVNAIVDIIGIMIKMNVKFWMLYVRLPIKRLELACHVGLATC